MQAFVAPLMELAEFESIIKQRRSKKGMIQIAGCVTSQKSHMMYALSDDFSRKIIVTSSEMKAKQIYEEYKVIDSNVYLYPAKDLLFYQADLRGKYLIKQRMEVFQAMMEQKQVTVITSFDGFMDALIPLEEMEKRILSLEVGQVLDILREENYFGTPLPDIVIPRREVADLKISLALSNKYKSVSDINLDIDNILKNYYQENLHIYQNMI